jgi:parvulin-like peptidyl-prolyl isomerase
VRKLAVLVALGASVLAAGCDLAPYAAKVNGTTISQADLKSDLDAIRQNQAFLAGLQSQGAVLGSGASTFDSQFVASVLGGKITVTLVRQELARRGIDVTSADLDLARQNVVASFSSQAGSSAAGTAIFESFTPAYQQELVHDSAELTALEASLAHVDISPAALKRYYLAHQADYAQVCVSQIQVADHATGQQILFLIDHGASFASLARSRSTDSSSASGGGALGCAPTRDLSTALAPIVDNLMVGAVAGPVQLNGQGPWHLFQVTSRTIEPFSQVEAQVQVDVIGQRASLVTGFVDRLGRRTSVTVNPLYGRYVGAGAVGGVLPPIAPRPSLLTAPTTPGASTVSGSPPRS